MQRAGTMKTKGAVAKLGSKPMPRLNAIPPGCSFNPRCPRVMDRCRVERPELITQDASSVACWLYAEEEAGVGVA